jgi:uncharacterized protein YutE (UPF0331/DUF86 family)
VERLARLEDYVRLLDGLRGRTFDDPYARLTLERAFHLAAEAALDVGEMLIARRGWTKPATYRDVVRVLGDEGVLPAEFADRFAGMASLRNLLVHDYTRIDHTRLAALLHRLDDFRTYARHVVTALQEAPE